MHISYCPICEEIKIFLLEAFDFKSRGYVTNEIVSYSNFGLKPITLEGRCGI